MAYINITDTDLSSIKDKVVLVTGASSGIGLATITRLASHGAKVFASDLNELPEPQNTDPQISFLKADVTVWRDLVVLFNAAVKEYGRIDHVFANAGITSMANLLEEDVDDNGDPLPPNLKTIEVNLISVMMTAKLAIHHLRKEGGSIVCIASASAYSRFTPTDYTTAKHGVLGLVRSLTPNLHPNLPIRINGVAPTWTTSAILPKPLMDALGSSAQDPDIVAKSVILLMVDGDRHGQMLYSDMGKVNDVECGEKGLLRALQRARGVEGVEEIEEIEGEEMWMRKMREILEGMAEATGGNTRELIIGK